MQDIPDSAQPEHPLEEENGQGLAEYALNLGLIAVVAIAALIFLGSAINDLMVVIGSTIDSAT